MAENQLELDRHQELGEFLRSRRARLAPETVGFPRGARRRTPGLRREEVAMLAGVSPEWYTWLEQGRDIHVSVQVLESLARILQLDAGERQHLFLLAHRQPAPVATYSAPTISATLQQFLDQLGAIPACAVDARLNVVAWNAAYCAIFGDFATKSERERNLIWRIFTSPALAQAGEERVELAEVILAQFRAGYARFISDPWWADQIEELRRVSPRFRQLWSRHDVLNVAEGRKLMHHPLVGELAFDFLWFQSVEPGELRLLIHSPRPNTGTMEKMERLLAPMPSL